jgi:hypothetical protein
MKLIELGVKVCEIILIIYWCNGERALAIKRSKLFNADHLEVGV